MRVCALAIVIGLIASTSEAQPASNGPPAPVMLFFDWSKPDIRRDDQALLDQVANAYRTRPSARLTLAGHTDRSGSAAFNHAAGLKRAQTVRSELENRGVPRHSISIVSFGEDQLLVPTEDGVREVQNRRVVITFEE